MPKDKPAPVRCDACGGDYPQVTYCRACDKRGWKLTKQQREQRNAEAKATHRKRS